MNPQLAMERAKAECAVELANHPEILDDEKLRHDTIEGNTSAFEVLAALVQAEVEDKAIMRACEYAIERYESRAEAAQRRIGKRRRSMMKIMDGGELTKVRMPIASLSRSNGPRRVIITDEAEVPESYCRIKREPAKDIIREALEAGEYVPGAALSNGETTLRVLVAPERKKPSPDERQSDD